MRVVVRNFGSSKTHLADVTSTSGGLAFGKPYRKPPSSTRALCGVRIIDGVVMQEGTRLKCSACLYFNDKEDEQHGENE